MNRYCYIAGVLILFIIMVPLVVSSEESDRAILKQLTDLELLYLAQAEETVFLDTGYFVSIENLNDLPTDQVTYDFDYISDGGGTAVIDSSTARFKPARVDLLYPQQKWLGPYITYQPDRISIEGRGYDPGTLLDLWGNPYYLFTPIGLVRPPGMSITLELYGDEFDLYAVVSLGPDGVKSADDAYRTFGFPPTVLVISSVRPARAVIGEQVTVKGYNFGNSQNGSRLYLNDQEVTTITNWSDRQIIFKVPPGASSGQVVVEVGTNFSNSFPLQIITSAISWSLYP